MRDFYRNLCRQLALATLWLSGAGFIVMTGVIFWQVIARYILNSSPAWSEQLALMLMTAVVFLGAAAGVYYHFHIRIAVVVNMLPEGGAAKVTWIANACVALCGFVLLYFGAELVTATWQHVVPAMGIPRGLIYVPAPVSGLLIMIFSFEKLFYGEPSAREESLWS